MSRIPGHDPITDLILDTARAAHQTFAAGVLAGDAAGDSARKLARLIEAVEDVRLDLNGATVSMAVNGSVRRLTNISAKLAAAIEEAKR